MTANPPKPLPPLDYLREIIDYDPLTGSMKWTAAAVTPGNCRKKRVGAEITDAVPRGYRRAYIRGKYYPCHRIAFALGHGREPILSIDHIDGNPANNALSNLREATLAQQAMNKAGWSATARGVSYNKGRGYYQAYITINRRMRSIGAYATAEEAIAAREKVARQVHGEFFSSRNNPRGSAP